MGFSFVDLLEELGKFIKAGEAFQRFLDTHMPGDVSGLPPTSVWRCWPVGGQRAALRELVNDDAKCDELLRLISSMNRSQIVIAETQFEGRYDGRRPK